MRLFPRKAGLGFIVGTFFLIIIVFQLRLWNSQDIPHPPLNKVPLSRIKKTSKDKNVAQKKAPLALQQRKKRENDGDPFWGLPGQIEGRIKTTFVIPEELEVGIYRVAPKDSDFPGWTKTTSSPKKDGRFSLKFSPAFSSVDVSYHFFIHSNDFPVKEIEVTKEVLVGGKRDLGEIQYPESFKASLTVVDQKRKIVPKIKLLYRATHGKRVLAEQDGEGRLKIFVPIQNREVELVIGSPGFQWEEGGKSIRKGIDPSHPQLTLKVRRERPKQSIFGRVLNEAGAGIEGLELVLLKGWPAGKPRILPSRSGFQVYDLNPYKEAATKTGKDGLFTFSLFEKKSHQNWEILSSGIKNQMQIAKGFWIENVVPQKFPLIIKTKSFPFLSLQVLNPEGKPVQKYRVAISEQGSRTASGKKLPSGFPMNFPAIPFRIVKNVDDSEGKCLFPISPEVKSFIVTPKEEKYQSYGPFLLTVKRRIFVHLKNNVHASIKVLNEEGKAISGVKVFSLIRPKLFNGSLTQISNPSRAVGEISIARGSLFLQGFYQGFQVDRGKTNLRGGVSLYLDPNAPLLLATKIGYKKTFVIPQTDKKGVSIVLKKGAAFYGQMNPPWIAKKLGVWIQLTQIQTREVHALKLKGDGTCAASNLDPGVYHLFMDGKRGFGTLDLGTIALKKGITFKKTFNLSKMEPIHLKLSFHGVGNEEKGTRVDLFRWGSLWSEVEGRFNQLWIFATSKKIFKEKVDFGSLRPGKYKIVINRVGKGIFIEERTFPVPGEKIDSSIFLKGNPFDFQFFHLQTKKPLPNRKVVLNVGGSNLFFLTDPDGKIKVTLPEHSHVQLILLPKKKGISELQFSSQSMKYLDLSKVKVQKNQPIKVFLK